MERTIFKLSGHAIDTAKQAMYFLTRNEKRAWLRQRIADNSHKENDRLITKFLWEAVKCATCSNSSPQNSKAYYQVSSFWCAGRLWQQRTKEGLQKDGLDASVLQPNR